MEFFSNLESHYKVLTEKDGVNASSLQNHENDGVCMERPLQNCLPCSPLLCIAHSVAKPDTHPNLLLCCFRKENYPLLLLRVPIKKGL